MISSKRVRTGFEADVGHPHHRQPRPAVGAHAAARSRARRPRPSPDRRARPTQMPSRTASRGGRRRALVVEAERAERARDRRVDGDVHQLRAVPHRAELGEVEPRRAGVRRLPAEDAVELDGVADRLVDLQRQLLGAEDQRRLAARARRGGQQLAGLRADPGRVAPRGRARRRTPSRCVPYCPRAAGYERRCVSPSPIAVAMIPAPLSRMCWSMRWPSLETNHFARVPQLVQRPRPGRRRARASSSSPARAGRPCRRARPRTGRRAHSLAHEPGRRLARHAARLDARDTSALAAAISAARAPGVARRRASARSGDGEEAPARPDEGPHADARVGVLGDRLDVAVAGRHRLVAPVHHPCVGVAGAGVERGLHRQFGGCELAHGPTLGVLRHRPSRGRGRQRRWPTSRCARSGTPRAPSGCATTRSFDRLLAPFGDAVVAALAPAPGESVLDVGCGFGTTLAALVEPGPAPSASTSRPR